MIMLRRIADCKDDYNLSIESVDLLRGEVRPRLEGQSINSFGQGKIVRQKMSGATISVGGSFSNLSPTAVGVFDLKSHGHAAGRSSARCVQHVGGDCAHWLISFSNLNRVIFRCSSAAPRNSVPRSFRKRSFKAPSTSSESFPVAQTMKMKPKRSSYSRFPAAKAALVSVAAACTPDCSRSDQLRACSDCAAAAFCSPIFG